MLTTLNLRSYVLWLDCLVNLNTSNSFVCEFIMDINEISKNTLTCLKITQVEIQECTLLWK